MLAGLGLMLLGFLLPALMLLQILPSTLLLNFLSYAFSLVGLILGFLGVLSYTVKNRRR